MAVECWGILFIKFRVITYIPFQLTRQMKEAVTTHVQMLLNSKMLVNLHNECG